MLSIQIHLHFQMYNSFSSRISQGAVRSEPKVHDKQHQTNDHLNAIHLIYLYFNTCARGSGFAAQSAL